MTAARFGAPGVILEVSLGVENLQRLGGTVALVGQGGHFVPRSLLLQRFFFLQDREPERRIFFNLSAALIVDPAPSGLIPGGKVDGCSIEVQQRRWRMTLSLFKFPVKVLFRKREDLVVISSFFGFLSITCTHRLK
jgi:hypothetical protein